MSEQAVIVGAGQAGVTLASALREEGFDGRIRLIGAEAHMPYQRPPLSKDFMASSEEAPRLLRSDSFYRDNDIELLLGESVTRIDPRDRSVTLDSGTSVPFTRLALATGGSPCRPAGTDLADIHCLRNLDDARAIRQRIADEARIVIVGGGFIGLELAATLTARGHEVIVLENASRLMGRAVSRAVSEHFRQLHEAWGVRLLFNERPARFVSSAGRLQALITSSGRRIPTEVAILGVGIVPETGLAEAAGLPCQNGIEVDAHMSAGPEWLVAVGDCTRFPQYHSGVRLRLESVQNATDQARCAAASLMGRPQPYTAVPWFWSGQRGERLQIAGVAPGSDREVIRGDPASGRFSVFRYRGRQLMAVDSVNEAAVHMRSRKLIARGITPEAAMAGDPDFDLKALVDS